MKLSIIIPVYNEEQTISSVIQNIQLHFKHTEYEILVVDDGSTDTTLLTIQSLAHEHIKIISYLQNKGKGFAIRKGLEHVSGDYVAIQDADLEYSPSTLLSLWESIHNDSLILYGKRTRRLGYISNRIANALLSHICNFLYGSHLYDIYTCYKIIPLKIFKDLNLVSNGFEIEAEITAKLLTKKLHITEVPISYTPRTLRDGKKIRTKDGFIGLWTLIKHRFLP